MNEAFNIHAARRLENIRLSTLLEASAVQRETDLNALLRAAAARGGAMSGGLLQEEVEIILAATETIIDTVIAYRKELAARVPDLLLAHPYLQEFHAKLDQLADGAVIAVQQRHATRSSAVQFPAATLNAVVGVATRRVKTLKNKITNEIQAMALEGELGMHRKDQSQRVTNVFHGPVANVAQNSEHSNQTANLQPSEASGDEVPRLSAGLPAKSHELPVKAAPTNPWLSGSFYLFAGIVLIFGALTVARLVHINALPIVLIFGVLALSAVGAMQLRHDEKLSEKSFLSLMLASLRSLPLLKRSKG